MSKYCNEGYSVWPANLLDKIFQQLESSNRMCLEYQDKDINNIGIGINSIRFYGRYSPNLDSMQGRFKYMIIISNDERRRLYREYKKV